MRQFLLLLTTAAALSAQGLVITPNPLTITTQANTGASATLTFTSTGAALNFLVASNASWLHVSPTTQLTTPAQVTVSTDPMASSNSSSLTVTIQGQNSVSVPVSLNVSPVGVNPSPLSFAYVIGSSTPPAQAVTVTLPSGTTASVAPSTDSGGNWLDLAVTGGSSPTAITATIDPTVAATLTAAGSPYTGKITITPSSGTAAVVPVTLTVTTTPQVTITPSSLSFSYQIGGTNNVTSQNLALSAGAQAIPSFSITPTVPWMSVSQSVGSIPANGVVNITVTIVQPSPNPGTSTGMLSLTTTGTVQIPVTVVESTTPLLNVPSTPLSFSYSIGGTAPAAQSFTPTSTGAPATQATYTLSASQPWITVPASGTTPNPVSVSVNPANLAPGNYSGVVTVTNTTTSGAAALQVPVTLTVTNNPVLVTSASSLAFVYQTGQQQPAAQTLAVSSSTGQPLNYTATTSTSWIVLTGHTTGTSNDSFTVAVNTTGVAAGANSGQVSIAVTDPATSASVGTVNIPVTLFVSNSALLVVSPPPPVVFTVQAGQTSAVQNINLTSTSSDVLTLSVSQAQTDSGGQWLFESGVPTATPGTLSLITVPPASLAPGTYTGSATITATGPSNATVLDSPYKIPVVLNVITGTIKSDTPSLSFTQVVGAGAPVAQTFNVTSSGPALNFFVTPYDNGLGWLSASTATGATPGVVSVSVNGSKLSPGTYPGRVVVSSNFAGGSPLVVPVTLVVSSGTLTAAPAALVFTAAAGSTAALSQNVALSSTPGAINFNVAGSTAGGGSWLSATPTSGTTPGTLAVSINPTGLGINTYTGVVTVTPTGAGGAPITIPVTLNIVAAQTLSVTPTTLSFSYVLGQSAPASQTVQVQLSGGAAPFTASASTNNNSGNWLTVTPASGTTPGTLTVGINPQGLAAGAYTGTISVASPNALGTTFVQVSLNVAAAAKPVIKGIENGANGVSTAISPGENITLFGTGLGPNTAVSGVLGSDGKVATTLSDTQVLFDGQAAPIVYVGAANGTQAAVMAPFELAGRPSTSVQIVYKGVASDPFTISVAAVVPGLYTQNQSGTGPALAFNPDGSINGQSHPIAKGGTVAVYMTGNGQTSPLSVTGEIIPANGSVLKMPILGVSATVDGIATTAIAVDAPGFVAGFFQVNVVVPPGVHSGAVPIVVSLGASSSSAGIPTQNGVTVAVQ